MHITQLLTSRSVTLASTFMVLCLLTSVSVAECSRSSFWEPPACYQLDFVQYPGGPPVDSRECAHPSGKNCYYPKELRATNSCNYEVKVRVVVNKGEDEIFTLKPGGTRSSKAFQSDYHDGSEKSSKSAYYRWWACCREGNAQCK